jgi:hypothetical protein
MPSTVVDMTAATRTLATEKRNAKIKPSSIVVNNVTPVTDADLTFNDVFTPAVTNGVAVPVLTTIPRLHINIGAGICQSVEDKLDDIEFLGLVQVVRIGADANCFVTFAYNFT